MQQFEDKKAKREIQHVKVWTIINTTANILGTLAMLYIALRKH